MQTKKQQKKLQIKKPMLQFEGGINDSNSEDGGGSEDIQKK